ncbi:hypothetical protein D3C71_1805480 [compost metagenome]
MLSLRLNGLIASMALQLWFMKLRPTWSEALASPLPSPERSRSAAELIAPADRITSFGDRRFFPPLWV